MKECTKCRLIKNLNDFGVDNSTKDKYRASCKECRKQYYASNLNKIKEYRINNSDKIKLSQKIYNSKRENRHLFYNKEKRKEYYINNKEKSKNYQIKNADKIREQRKKYYKNKSLVNPLFKLSNNIRCLIRMSIKGKGFTKRSNTYNILGCTFEEFKVYLESQFTDGMTWENQGKWHMDHIYPVSLAKDEEHLIKLNHYTNFQPLWALDNRIKSNKVIGVAENLLE